MLKLGYSNYGMKEFDVFQTLPRLRSIGYEANEICVRDGWQTAAHHFDKGARRRLVLEYQRLGFPPPPLMEALEVSATGPERAAMLERARESFTMARDLNFGDSPAVVTTTVGALKRPWNDILNDVLTAFIELADVASSFNVVVAIEAHAGSELNTPEKVVWLVERARHDHLKLNFDISHFVVQGIPVQRCVDLCLPHTVHTHVKDGRMVDGRVRYQLPGEGNMDLVHYLRAVTRAGLIPPVFVEVSRQISEAKGFDAWHAAEFCYRALDRARREADAQHRDRELAC